LGIAKALKDGLETAPAKRPHTIKGIDKVADMDKIPWAMLPRCFLSPNSWCFRNQAGSRGVEMRMGPTWTSCSVDYKSEMIEPWLETNIGLDRKGQERNLIAAKVDEQIPSLGASWLLRLLCE
jgi:hypothetical protein